MRLNRPTRLTLASVGALFVTIAATISGIAWGGDTIRFVPVCINASQGLFSVRGDVYHKDASQPFTSMTRTGRAGETLKYDFADDFNKSYVVGTQGEKCQAPAPKPKPTPPVAHPTPLPTAPPHLPKPTIVKAGISGVCDKKVNQYDVIATWLVGKGKETRTGSVLPGKPITLTFAGRPQTWTAPVKNCVETPRHQPTPRPSAPLVHHNPSPQPTHHHTPQPPKPAFAVKYECIVGVVTVNATETLGGKTYTTSVRIPPAPAVGSLTFANHKSVKYDARVTAAECRPVVIVHSPPPVVALPPPPAPAPESAPPANRRPEGRPAAATYVAPARTAVVIPAKFPKTGHPFVARHHTAASANVAGQLASIWIYAITGSGLAILIAFLFVRYARRQTGPAFIR